MGLVNTYGIDFGTCNIKVFNQRKKQIVNQRNMIALQDRRVVAVGNDAYEMFDKAPEDVEITCPISAGVIASIAHTQLILRKFAGRGLGLFSRSCDYCVAIPSDLTEVQKRAFHRMIYSANIHARRVYIVDRAVADAVGLGIDVRKANGVLLVDIGADTAEVSVLSGGGIILSRLVSFGGNRLDEAVQMMIRRKYNLNVGIKTAEQIKITYGTVGDVPEKAVCQVEGSDVVSGMPASRQVLLSDVRGVIRDPMLGIVDSIRFILERTPPELSADLYRNGMYLTGGTSLLSGLDELVAGEIGLPVKCFENPSESIVRGLAQIITDPAYGELAHEPKEKLYY